MSSKQNVIKVVDRIAAIAGGIKEKLSIFIWAGTAATAYLAWGLYSQDSALWWNVIKCGFIAMPALIAVFVWSVLGQLQEAPELVAKLAQDDEGVFSNIEDISVSQPEGLSGVFSTLRTFRRESGLSVIFDTISGIGLIVNPVFALLAFAAFAVLFILMLVALLLLVF